jgi:hypothetical protein
MKLHVPAGAVALALSLTSALCAQATFTAIPEATAVVDITPDGKTTLVHNFFTGEVWLRTAAGGLQPIGTAWGVESLSADATVVSGTRFLNDQEVASRWTAAGGWQDLGGLVPGDLGCGGFLSAGFEVSGDGAIQVGLGWENCKGRAFRWTEAGGMQELSQLGPGSARANAISADGLTIGGFDEHAQGPRRPSVWFPDGSEMIIGGEESVGEVQAISNDGSVIAGELNTTAFYWTAATGPVDLGLLPGGFGLESSSVFAMSGDGHTLAGNSGSFGPFGNLSAFLWTPERGMENLRDRLNAEGAAIPDTFTLNNAVGVSGDGRTLVGWGIDYSSDPFGAQTGWIATLGPQLWFDLGHALAGSAGTPKLTGDGLQIATTKETLVLQHGAPGAAAYVVAGLDRVDAPMKGGVLVPSPDLVAILPLDAAGGLTITFRWPAGLPSATSMYFQAWIADAAGPAGFAASNALECVTP